MKTLTKLLGLIGVSALGYEGYLVYRKKNSFTPLVAGHAYTVVLDYAGKGVGGSLSVQDVQGILDAGPAGPGAFQVGSAVADPGKKTITYSMLVEKDETGNAATLAPSSFPSPYGSLSIALVQDLGVSGLNTNL